MTRRPPHRFTRRLAATLPVWLVLGALLNAIVAWGVLLVAQEHVTSTIRTREVATPWPVEVPAHWAKQSMITTAAHDWTRDSVLYFYYGDKILVPGTDIRTETGSLEVKDAGWPLRSLRGWFIHGTPDVGHIRKYEIRVPVSDISNIFLPYRPLWPGFAVNTLFYAAIAWGLWQVPMYLRRRHRVKRNRCTRCGYDRAGLAGGAACPECGSA